METVESDDDRYAGTFECARCGFETPARVRAWARLRVRRPSDAARAMANETASAIASRTLMFVPCPKCGQRDPRATTYRVQIILAALAMGIAGFATAFVGMFKTSVYRTLGDATPVVAAAVGAAWAFAIYRRYRLAWTRIDERVQLG